MAACNDVCSGVAQEAPTPTGKTVVPFAVLHPWMMLPHLAAS